ncbi:dimeric dUTPase (all-alpha-NTP-PPase superfamily) [Anoxybacillus vitaminiphilus]|uniref:Dimeric dUTPase (All-alpha-NTP-PPase superfamily) n=1 Tax=Paranoxybacillus vitaminiphilus TaxID=581036 RepID=A0A327YJI8_9BACL|nr:dUTP diphosphatase [Anoxybacillus vitaminiphilus]RAK21120.1 dimeric dUTPase (all-alpha-NTP-PPase superfamily) [Anoxybacillus vitaminiphilus]
MNLQKLFELQRHLDERIIREKGLGEEELIPKKIMAFLIELGELANELPEIFKFWSNKKNNYEKALVEYVDGLHFLLSIGLEQGVLYQCMTIHPIKQATVFEQFAAIYLYASAYWAHGYSRLFNAYIGLGEMLGFTWEQIEKAYMQKNTVNHQRQESGY